jgi:hypothetical protein
MCRSEGNDETKILRADLERIINSCTKGSRGNQENVSVRVRRKSKKDNKEEEENLRKNKRQKQQSM